MELQHYTPLYDPYCAGYIFYDRYKTDHNGIIFKHATDVNEYECVGRLLDGSSLKEWVDISHYSSMTTDEVEWERISEYAYKINTSCNVTGLVSFASLASDLIKCYTSLKMWWCRDPNLFGDVY